MILFYIMNSNDVLRFWFGDRADDAELAKERRKLWWSKNASLDREISERFEGLIEAFMEGELESWEKTPKGVLALIILTDQFPRNIYRNRPKAFDFDKEARKLCKTLIRSGDYLKLRSIERVFACLPLEHAESKNDQEESVKHFRVLLDAAREDHKDIFQRFFDYAIRHKEVIDRFGRFPHRNRVLGRESTEEEVEFLKQPGSSF